MIVPLYPDRLSLQPLGAALIEVSAIPIKNFAELRRATKLHLQNFAKAVAVT
jgi:hypothetical protein